MSLHTPASQDATHLGKNRAGLAMKAALAVAAIGILAAIAGAVVDHHRFAFAYLTGFAWVLTIGLGGLFFILIQHVTRAGWSVAPRRQAEWLAGILPVTVLLFIPIAIFSHDLYHHWMGPEAANDEILRKKSGYLNPTFFYVRAAIYFASWILLSWLFRRKSLEQDVSGDPNITLKLQAWSAPALPVFALTLTFAAFDWLMSLDPHWYSTIYGVYVFSGGVVSSLSALALLTIALQKTGLLARVSTVEHRHDIGKLLFGFTVFWAYIGFSQFFLIWYANIPEETLYFVHRWEHGWKAWSLLLLFGHFVLPFLLLLSRHAKRSNLLLGIAAVWQLAMHWVDMYWLVMPTHSESFTLSWIDFAGLLAPLGVLAVYLAYRASKDPLYPLKDPRLSEAVQLVNL